MPNWCQNELSVSSKKPVYIDNFIKFVKSDEDEEVFDFNKIIPYPKKYADADKAQAEWRKIPGNENKYGGLEVPDGFNHGGYDWCLKNWGTKWNACNQHPIT